MKGLLRKDYRIVCIQKRYFMMILLLGLIITYGSVGTFSIGYLTMIGAFFTISTLSYDEMNNGMSFLLSMPIKREDYVKEKYALGLILSFLFWTISILLSLAVYMIKRQAFHLSFFLITAGGIYLSTIIMFAIIMPCVIKMGAEKGRTVAIGVFLVLCIGIYGISRLCPGLTNTTFWNRLIQNHIAAMIIVSLLLVIVFFVLSCRISCCFMKKKEF